VPALSEPERAEVRRLARFANWANQSLAWGTAFPTAVDPMFYLNNAFDKLTDDGNELVRRDLQRCLDVERQMDDARGRLRAAKVGDITLNQGEIEALRGELDYWVIRLLNQFAAYVNPYAMSYGGARNGVCFG
jgi:hypothetical protein